MGLFDSFKKKNKKEEKNSSTNLYELDDYDYDYDYSKLTIDINMPHNATIPKLSKESTSDFLLETRKKEFDKKYAKIETLKSAVWLYEETGILSKDVNIELQNYLKLPAEDRKTLFFPYLKEKELLNILDLSDKKELDTILSTLKVGDKGTQTLPADYKCFGKAVIHLQAMGIINIDDDNIFKNTFDYYGNTANLKEMIKEMAGPLKKEYGLLENKAANSFSYDGSVGESNSYNDSMSKRSR